LKTEQNLHQCIHTGDWIYTNKTICHYKQKQYFSHIRRSFQPKLTHWRIIQCELQNEDGSWWWSECIMGKMVITQTISIVQTEKQNSFTPKVAASLFLSHDLEDLPVT